MGLLSKGTPLSWEETKRRSDYVRRRGILQFIKLYREARDRRNDRLLWGDEVEYMLVRFDHAHRRVQLLLRGAELIHELNERELQTPMAVSLCSWHPEFGAYAMEAVPGLPYGDTLAHCNVVEHNMRQRRAEVSALLGPDEEIMCITVFPRLGCAAFTQPPHEPSLNSVTMPSLFVPEQMIYPAHPRFRTLARNIRMRRGKRVVINVPIFQDVNTPRPFVEDLAKLGADQEALLAALPDHVYMDAMGFGMGNCCLQVTLQACDISEAMRLYDQLANVCPVMLALGASSPVFRGYLVDRDCRFDVISMAVDDRTDDEMNTMRPRYASIPCFICAVNECYNDVPLAYNHEAYRLLRSENISHGLAMHLSHVFVRDSLSLFREKLGDGADNDYDHFENLQSTSWHTLRFKPPPPNTDIGWRVEFRPMELNMTEFENAAYVVFVVLLTRAILTFDLDLVVPISKVDENMRVAQRVDAVLNETLWFREDVASPQAEPRVARMTLSEIVNGKQSVGFPGLVPLVRAFLAGIEEVDVSTRCTVEQYLQLIEKRASGQLMTAARWIRHFVTSHPEYKKDSVVSDGITYDLVARINRLQHNFWCCPELIGTPASRSTATPPASPAASGTSSPSREEDYQPPRHGSASSESN
ncbi:hypothetical protein HPB49_007564 [Dermacentor silvarum]|uniref:Uncharacterized protein n=1 Tax=Dermacentor silvarum TaxID=543639 RepID=A0ACB8C825_DERSI|nr:glutamate--cysteine ligase catalytic subunit [Dermacentor silvarum]KAH7937047.1 hypothetical protein HPB49_007564 [Dermacentor silvarum]